LISYFSGQTACKSFSSKGTFTSLNNLINCWRSAFPGLSSGEYPDLIEAVDQWRKARNKTVHEIVKSEPSQVTQPIETLLEKARDAAEEGERLTKEVCKWRNREKTKERRLSSSPVQE
jgi:hypothetical protein